MANVIALAESFRSELLRGDAKTVLAMSRRWSAVEALLSGSIEALAQEIADLKAAGEDVPKYKLWQLDRFQSLLAQIAGEMAKYSQWAIIQMKEDAVKAQQLGAKHAKQMLLASMDAARAAQLAFDKLPTEAVENITALAQQGQPLEKLLQAAYPTAVEGIVNQLVYGTAVGRNPRETARLAVKKGLAGGLNHILLVARDQQIRNYREMVRHQYGRSGVVYGYMRVAARNTRTCMACIAQDGRIYAVGEPMALHPQDRCVAAGERVRTSDGDKPIEAIREGDYVLTKNGRYRRVLKTKSRHYAGQMIRIQYNGRVLMVTPEHKIKTQRGWVEARHLKADDILETF
ncbi:MAG: hypothetical protein D6688_14295 [Alphaproteobacteria bacterium]|nr:MAG: hypothetical protein D6688_14295 [Alphaproteobacteria bacterium]